VTQGVALGWNLRTPSALADELKAHPNVAREGADPTSPMLD